MTASSTIQLIECPRDAMQGWTTFIPTDQKIKYINGLLKVGFNTIDFGSFVSPKAIPQMRDTREVLRHLEWSQSASKLLAIVANIRGAEEAVQENAIQCLGFPFSISETFQQRNTNSSISDSVHTLQTVKNLCDASGKELVVYLSMGFGNPYGDPYNETILLDWTQTMVDYGIRIISLADTVGIATPHRISVALQNLIPKYADITIGVHLHADAANWQNKLSAAVDAGCKRIDGALKGIGGCPMAGNELVGNMPMENIIHYLDGAGEKLKIEKAALQESLLIAAETFIH